MHIFLTGQIQIGKSTAIEHALELLDPLKLGGFRTISVPTEIPKATHEVYIVPVSGEYKLDRNHLIGIRWGSNLHTAFPGAFETGGCEILRNTPKDAQLFIMDELGMMENDAPQFRTDILHLLDGDIPILGVIKPKSSLLLDAIRIHPKVQLVEVTQENRDTIPDVITILLTPHDHDHHDHN